MTRHQFPCPVLARGQTCTPCEEVAAIDQEIATLKAKRTIIYRRMNHTHDPLTSKLPPEIVGKIFTNFLPVDVDPAYGVSVKRPEYDSVVVNPLSLGAICTAWRAIAWSTPQLWTSISVCLDYINRARCTLLRAWLRRSGQLPLYVNIYQENYTNDRAPLKEVIKLFTLQSHRWFHFEYNMEETHFRDLKSAFMHARILNTLKIGIGGTPDRSVGMLPNLRNLSMAEPCMDNLSGINWQNLTGLEAIFSSINMCSWLFLNAPNLTCCTFSIQGFLSRGDTGTAGNTIHQHDRLRFLHIKEWDTDTDTALHLLQFPALQHLTIDSNREVAVVTILDFLRRSKCSLKILDMNIKGCTPEETRKLFVPLADIPSLENLELRCRPDGYYRTACYSIDDLRNPPPPPRKRVRKTR